MTAGGAADAVADAGDDDTEPCPSLVDLFDDHHSSLLYIYVNYNLRFIFLMHGPLKELSCSQDVNLIKVKKIYICICTGHRHAAVNETESG